jgi:hypothetical protein
LWLGFCFHTLVVLLEVSPVALPVAAIQLTCQRCLRAFSTSVPLRLGCSTMTRKDVAVGLVMAIEGVSCQ